MPPAARSWYCRQLVQTVAARGSVFLRSTGTASAGPASSRGPWPITTPPVPAGLPDGFPDTLVQADRTVGNSVSAHLGDDGPAVQGALQDGVVVFDPPTPAATSSSPSTSSTWNCSMHDFFYLLGFQEGDGSFQRDNFGRGGLARRLGRRPRLPRAGVRHGQHAHPRWT